MVLLTDFSFRLEFLAEEVKETPEQDLLGSSSWMSSESSSTALSP
jgi:hypothetical protein